ncbi:cell division/GTP binding protein [Backusella circina FSU 941]|nr:cell division/GTP binding protein [Backusella circina FSU 941]
MVFVSRRNKTTTSRFNIMTVGYSGTGKSGFIRTLLKALELEKKTRRDSGHATPNDEQPTQQVSSVSTEIEISNKERVLLTLIDTPGFSIEYKVDQQLRDIIQYIEHQFDLTLEQEAEVKRNPKTAIDTRIHCCLYFIDPEKKQLDDYDVRILTRLSKRVNVIPVIGKADYLTKAQRSQLKSKIIHDIYSTYKIPVYGMPSLQEQEQQQEWHAFLEQFDYEQEEVEAQTMLDYLYNFPFTTMAYEQDVENDSDPSHHVVLGRDFGWATVNCLNKAHCDFSQLKDSLVTTHRLFLTQDTIEHYYEQYRTEKLLTKRITLLDSQKLLSDISNL